MGYSLDTTSTTTIFSGASIAVSVPASPGSHMLHIKSWGNKGASCTADVKITVIQKAATATTTTNVVVTSPTSGASVTSPFPVAASGTTCLGQSVTALGYSLDASSSTTIVNGTTLGASVAAATGAHTLHVKSWGKSGASCVSDIPLTVKAGATSSGGPSIPVSAVITKALQDLTTWTAEHDAGTSGSSSGSMSLVSSPAMSGQARQFATTYSNYGGERYNIKFGKDQASTNFVFDAELYIAGSASGISNLELDLNQVMANGQTVIFGFQCDGWSHTWDYAVNTGTPTSPTAHWMHSTQACNLQQWATNTWHHVQIEYSRDNSGNVTYKAVWLDGAEQDLNVTALSAFALGWGPSVNINVQLDGYTSTSGSSTIYVDNMALYSW
jgi:hypothetical protein